MPKSAYERMIAKVEKTPTCWLFNGAKHSRGYGNVRVIIDGKKTCRTAHKISYEHHKGPVPEGMVVRHMCDVRRCINPDHLELGTHQENINDIITRNRGRNQYGPWTSEKFIAMMTDDCPF